MPSALATEGRAAAPPAGPRASTTRGARAAKAGAGSGPGALRTVRPGRASTPHDRSERCPRPAPAAWPVGGREPRSARPPGRRPRLGTGRPIRPSIPEHPSSDREPWPRRRGRLAARLARARGEGAGRQPVPGSPRHSHPPAALDPGRPARHRARGEAFVPEREARWPSQRPAESRRAGRRRPGPRRTRRRRSHRHGCPRRTDHRESDRRPRPSSPWRDGHGRAPAG